MAKSDSKAQKKLPKRADSKHPKHSRRAILATRQAARKAARQAAQDAAAKRNKSLRANGELTPWDIAKARRAAKRA